LEDKTRKLNDKELNIKLLSYLRGQLFIFILMLITTVFRDLFNITTPLITRDIIDYVIIIPSGKPYDFIVWFADVFSKTLGISLLSALCVMIVLVTVVWGAVMVIHRWLLIVLIQRILYRIRQEFYSALLLKSKSFFENTPIGQLVARATNDVNQIGVYYAEPVRESVRATIRFIIIVSIMMSLDWQLTVITLIPLSTLSLMTIKYLPKIKDLRKKLRNMFGNLSSIISEAVIGHKFIKAYSLEERFKKWFLGTNNLYLKTILHTVKLESLYVPYTQLMNGISTALVILTFGMKWSAEGMDVGTFVLFVSYLGYAAGPIRKWGQLVSTYQDSMVAAKRVFEVIEDKTYIKEKPKSIEIPKIEGDISFRDVTLKYNGVEILSHVNIDINAGETVALVGPSGSGKTTLVSMIPRFLEPTSGTIRIDGIEIQKYKLKTLRSNIGWVMQDIILFPGTVKENLLIAKPDATMEEIIEACKKARAHDFIMKMPKGYDTFIGEGGYKLSSGQRQRLTIARVILADPPILILDDSTSHLDVETEREILRSLWELTKDRTTILISHRLSSILRADKIIFMDKGRVTEVKDRASFIDSLKSYMGIEAFQKTLVKLREV